MRRKSPARHKVTRNGKTFYRGKGARTVPHKTLGKNEVHPTEYENVIKQYGENLQVHFNNMNYFKNKGQMHTAKAHLKKYQDTKAQIEKYKKRMKLFDK